MERRKFLHLDLPVESVSPIGANLLEKPKIEPIFPTRISNRVRPAGSVQSSMKIVDRLLRERDRKRFQRHRSRPVLAGLRIADDASSCCNNQCWFGSVQVNRSRCSVRTLATSASLNVPEVRFQHV